ncbi:integral plasma membrane protein [Nadsonia fulvescens var. elongata DSM 6958]|uniref:Integral plasma membrane protein n=1 Tax=Nadsonia fulvescens var. elongata DSM 6958 TaxID=857566 RepID=A0A1E3PK80_9ASCO|nr:integral plasma membrane protein [Nadsonia fulvescens var. elongata DSM 6958]
MYGSRLAKPGAVLFQFDGKWIPNLHTVFALLAFLSSLIVGMWLHFHKIVQNEHYGYPEEWFPSVSAAIGDRYPERSLFQIFIAITSGPRFALVFLLYALARNSGGSIKANVVLISGLLRTFTCGGWVYITSTDDHMSHDVFMIAYLVLTIPWTVACLQSSQAGSKSLRYRKVFATLFFTSLIPLVYFFIEHKVHRIAGAYTIYAFFEWSLIFYDVLFDAAAVFDFKRITITITDNVPADVKSSKEAAHGEVLVRSARRHAGFSWISFTAAIMNSFTFWSVFTALPLLIWYFPLWYMGISGYEACLLAIVAPVVLGFTPLRSLLARFPQIAHLGTAVGIYAGYIADPVHRLYAVAIGAAFGCISLAIQFWGSGNKPSVIAHRASAFSIGLILSSIAKLYLWTNNPVWPIMNESNGGLNKEGLAIGIVGAMLASRPQYSPGQLSSVASKKEYSLPAAIGLGGLMFALHSLLSDSSTLTLWVWDGYPVTGPLPVPHGALVIFAMVFGVYLGATRKITMGGWISFFIGSAGAYVFYNNSGWIGFAGGLVLAIYLIAIVPAILDSAGRHAPGFTFAVAFFITVLLYLAHVWVVAYAFVPGGPLLRERTDIVLIAQQVCIGFGILGHTRIKTVNTKLGATALALTKQVRKQIMFFLTIVLILTSVITFNRFNRPDPQPFHPESKVMTAGIWTIHFGLDNDMWASEVRMRNLVQELEVDVIGFLESDTQRCIMGNRDITQRIAEELGYYTDFGPGPNKHTWGAALLSKFPILNSTHHLLPSPVGELAPAIHATLDVYGTEVDVVVFHSGQEEDIEDRRLQSISVAEIMGSSDRPLVLLSYLVTKPLQGNYNTYVSELSGMSDIDPSDWDRWCEYILYKNIKRIGYARVSRSTITDTELQVGKFVVGDNTPSTDKLIDEGQVDESLRFPNMFKGQGVRDHRYHVFDEPRYYA